jgi:hypothetical protein
MDHLRLRRYHADMGDRAADTIFFPAPHGGRYNHDAAYTTFRWMLRAGKSRTAIGAKGGASTTSAGASRCDDPKAGSGVGTGVSNPLENDDGDRCGFPRGNESQRAVVGDVVEAKPELPQIAGQMRHAHGNHADRRNGRLVGGCNH